MFDSTPKAPKAQNFHMPVDARVETVFALLNQRPDFANVGADCVFARDEIASLLKLSGDPWTAAMLAELANARWQAEALAESTRCDKVVHSLLGTERPRDQTLRLMRRAVNRPIEVAMQQAQDLLGRMQADKMPLTEGARQRMDEDLLGLQSAWLLYNDRLLAACMQLRDSPVQSSSPALAAGTAPTVTVATVPVAPAPAQARQPKLRPGQAAGNNIQNAPPRRRHTDCLPTLH